jgi:hypothetical protein
MMLPWLARKWGVSDERALALWNLACTEAEIVTGERNTSRYWGMAKSLLIDKLDSEVIASYPVLATPWIMMRLNVLRVVATMRLWFEYSHRTFA